MAWRLSGRARPGRLLADFLSAGRTYRYGEHASQVADLYLPRGAGPHPVVVLVHGGAWRARAGRAVMRGLVQELVRAGWAAWNVEYRRVGEGGGWPETFADVADAFDHLRRLDAPLDLHAVSAVGHSAGGHLALWAASRGRLPAGSVGAEPALSPAASSARGGDVELLELEGAAGRHRRHINPRGAAWRAAAAWLGDEAAVNGASEQAAQPQ